MGSAPTFLGYFLESSKSAPDQKNQGSRSTLAYLFANSAAWLTVAVMAFNGSSMILPAVIAAAVFSCGLSWLMHDRSRQSSEQSDRLQYQLKLSLQTIDKLKAEVSCIRQLDPVTNCFNATRFTEEVSQFVALNERSGLQFSVIRLCVDQYPEILGRDGLRTGNEILKIFSRILRASLREVDSVARLDDEHFAVLLSDSNSTGAIIVANRIRNLAEQLRTSREHERITLSMGLTECHGTEDSVKIIGDAETALNKSINQGGDCIACYNYQPPAGLQLV